MMRLAWGTMRYRKKSKMTNVGEGRSRSYASLEFIALIDDRFSLVRKPRFVLFKATVELSSIYCFLPPKEAYVGCRNFNFIYIIVYVILSDRMIVSREINTYQRFLCLICWNL